MAVFFVSEAVGSTGVGTTTINVPAGVVDRDLLVAVIRFDGSATVAASPATIVDPSGWTLVQDNSQTWIPDISTLIQMRTLIRVANSEPGSYTWTCNTPNDGTNNLSGYLFAYRGVNNQIPQDVSSKATNGLGNAQSLAVNTLTQNAMILSCVETNQTNIAPSNMTVRDAGALADAVVGPGAFYFAPGPWSPGSNFVAHTIALRAAADQDWPELPDSAQPLFGLNVRAKAWTELP